MADSTTKRILSQIPGHPWSALERTDELWRSLRNGSIPTPTVITQATITQATSPQAEAGQSDADGSEADAFSEAPEAEFDVVIAGATLGVLIGTALVQRGWRVALLERGELRGREQEWNISRQELQVLVELGLLTEAELEGAIASQYNPARISFHGGPEFWINDVLNLGVDPVVLLDQLKQKFLAAGGQLLEHTEFVGATVWDHGVTVRVKQDAQSQALATASATSLETSLTARLLLDMMGHFSPIARQARQGQTPDGICLVVGTCAQGFEQNQTGDLMASFTPLRNQCQYFWEAFPAKDGRTTYLFTYIDAHPDRPSLESLFDDYFELLPQYQQVALEQLNFKRALFGILPSYRRSPLKPAWDRILQVGDSSGTQSPLSFGGFGALLRHLDRLVTSLDEALQADCLTRSDLALINGYQPNLSVTWLFQRAMSVGMDQTVAPNQINDLLSQVFKVMDASGEAVLKPFLQDVVQFPALAQTMLKTGVTAPGTIAKVIPQVGLPALLGWTGHYGALAGYSAVNAIAPPLERQLKPQTKEGRSQPQFQLRPNQRPNQRFNQRLNQWRQLLRYGSGGDYQGD